MSSNIHFTYFSMNSNIDFTFKNSRKIQKISKSNASVYVDFYLIR